MWKFAGIVLVLLLSLSQVSFCAYGFYMELYGENQGLIRGYSPHELWRDKIVCFQLRHTVLAEQNKETCFPTGPVKHLPLTIVKEIDRSSPQLLAALDNHERLYGTLYFVRINPEGAEYVAYTIQFENAYISGIKHETSVKTDYTQELETVSFVYGEITKEWLPTGTIYGTRARPACGQEIRISDLNFDGTVNLLDLSMLADEWLAAGR